MALIAATFGRLEDSILMVEEESYGILLHPITVTTRSSQVLSLMIPWILKLSLGRFGWCAALLSGRVPLNRSLGQFSSYI